MWAMRGWLVGLAVGFVVGPVVGCGGNPPRRQVIGNRASYTLTTCADAAVIVHGKVFATDPTDAGRAREQLVASACERDRWSPDVLSCIGGEPKITGCLGQLTSEQEAAYTAQMLVFAQRWGVSAFGGGGYGGDAYGGDAYGGDMIGVLASGGGPDCSTLAASALSYPAGTNSSRNRDVARPLRERVVERECETQPWDDQLKECLQGASTSDDIAACLGQLDEASRLQLDAKLALVDSVAAGIVLTANDPTAIDCGHAVSRYYSDRQWKGKLVALEPDKRKRVIADSRTKMTTACGAESWDATERGCLASGGDDMCFADAAMTWGFPAAGVLGTTGLASCDLWGTVVQRVQTCAALPQDLRAGWQRKYTAASALWKSPSADRAEVARACQLGSEGITATAASPCQWQ
jgi:hypothetical protein